MSRKCFSGTLIVGIGLLLACSDSQQATSDADGDDVSGDIGLDIRLDIDDRESGLDASLDSQPDAGDLGQDTFDSRTEDGGGEPDATADAGDDTAADASDDALGDAPRDATEDGAGDVLAEPDVDAADVGTDSIDLADGGAELPDRALLGMATGQSTEEDLAAECVFFGEVIDLVETETGYEGLAIGEAVRRLIRGEMVQEFQALVAGPTFIDFTGETTVELRWVGEQPDTASPFWQALEVLEGDQVGDLSWEGEWECATLNIDSPGFEDTYLSVFGTWTLGPPPRP